MSRPEQNEACIQGLAACSARLSQIALELEDARREWLDKTALLFHVPPSKLAPLLSEAFTNVLADGTLQVPSDEQIKQFLSSSGDRRRNGDKQANVTATITPVGERLARLASDQVLIQDLAERLVYRLYDVPLESALAVERYLVSLA